MLGRIVWAQKSTKCDGHSVSHYVKASTESENYQNKNHIARRTRLNLLSALNRVVFEAPPIFTLVDIASHLARAGDETLTLSIGQILSHHSI